MNGEQESWQKKRERVSTLVHSHGNFSRLKLPKTTEDSTRSGGQTRARFPTLEPAETRAIFCFTSDANFWKFIALPARSENCAGSRPRTGDLSTEKKSQKWEFKQLNILKESRSELIASPVREWLHDIFETSHRWSGLVVSCSRLMAAP